MKYKVFIHEILVVCRITISFRGGWTYKRVVVIAVRVWCLHELRDTFRLILARGHTSLLLLLCLGEQSEGCR